VNSVVCVVCLFAGNGKLEKIHFALLIGMRSYPPQYQSSSNLLNSSPSLRHPLFSLFPLFVSSSLSFYPFYLFFVFLSCPPLFFFLSFFVLLFLTFLNLFVCVCVCVSSYVCMCARIWQFHACRPLITSSI